MLSQVTIDCLLQRDKVDCVLRDHRQRYDLGPGSTWKSKSEAWHKAAPLNYYHDTLDPIRRYRSSAPTVRVTDKPRTDDDVTKSLQNKMMTEMRQHLIRMNREKMIERGALTDKEAALLGKYSSLSNLATMEFSSETINTSDTSTGGSDTSRLWRELMY